MNQTSMDESARDFHHVIAASGRAPIALSIAGSDSSGGAGIQADLKTFSAFGVYGATAITALTAQNTRGVSAVHAVPGSFLRRQIDSVAEDLDVGAVKTGMLATADIVATVAEAIAHYRTLSKLGPLVVDPVMVATSGDVLLDLDAVATVRARLLPMAALATPNLEEAAVLTGRGVAKSLTEMAEQAREIGERFGPTAVLVKGGHGIGPNAIDVLWTADGIVELALARLPIGEAHGTGCTLSAAITALLACDVPLEDAVRRAKAYLWQALDAAQTARIGHGARPVDHLFDIKRHLPPA